MAGIQALSLDDPIYSVMIGDQAILITLANILEVAKLKNDLAMAHGKASDLDVELTEANEKLSVYWTKILEGQVIIGDYKRQLSEEKEVTQRLMKALEREIGWRGMIGVKHFLQGKFVKEVGNEFVEIVGDLASWLKKVKMEGVGSEVGGDEGKGGGVRSGREEMELEILRGIPVVLKSLKGKLEEGVVSKREEILSNLKVMKGILKTIGGASDKAPSPTIVDFSGKEGEQGQSSVPEKTGATSVGLNPLETGGGVDLEEFETFIEIVEDEDVPVPSPVGEGEPITSGDASDQFVFQGRESTSGVGGEDQGESPVKKTKRKKPTTSKVIRPRLIMKPIAVATCSTSTAADEGANTIVNENKHSAHPDNKRMCLCGFTTHVTNLNKHIWRLTEGRHTTRGPHVCSKCGDRFKAISALRKHVGAHTDGVPKKKSGSSRSKAAVKTLTCSTCLRFFPNKRALKNHRRKVHYSGSVTMTNAVVPPKKVKIVKMKMKGIGNGEQLLHQVNMDKKNGGSNGHFCKCGNRYFTRSALIAHIRKNTQQLQFKCDLCEQRFLWNSLLVQHLQRGHKIMPPSKVAEGETTGKSFTVSCSFCGGKFSKYDELYKHRKAVHGIGKKCELNMN